MLTHEHWAYEVLHLALSSGGTAVESTCSKCHDSPIDRTPRWRLIITDVVAAAVAVVIADLLPQVSKNAEVRLTDKQGIFQRFGRADVT